MTVFIIIGCLGSAFCLLFCLAACRAAGQSESIMVPEPVAILAIDDDLAFLSATRTLLETEGYAVHTASKPKEGIEFFANHRDEIQLVLLDFLMPEMTGDRVFECLRTIDPKVPILWVSGQVDRISPKNFGDGICDYLAKPFRLDDLRQKVQAVQAA